MKTYGTVELGRNKDKFVLNVEPHVAIKLKRVFPRVEASAKGTITITITDETARDLEWFMDRYPLETVNGASEAIAQNSAVYRRKIETMNELLAGVGQALPFDLALPLRDYQVIATRLALESKGLLIADDVGLGKTVDAIGMFCAPDTLPALYVTLTHLPKQMQDQIYKFAPHLYTHILRKGTPYELGTKLFDRFPDVLISNYHKLDGWKEFLTGRIKTVIFDEAQELRHSGTNKYFAAQLIRSKCTYAAGLSATPIFNYGGEFHHVMDILQPGALGTWDEFKTEWCSVIGGSGGEKLLVKDPKAFGVYLRDSGLMLRRTRKDVGRELKDPIIIPHAVDTDKEVFQKMSRGCEELARIIVERAEQYRGQKMQSSQQFDMLMRQATGIAKAGYAAEFIKLLLESEQKVLVYAWHREVYSILNNLLREVHPVMYTGTESPTQKDWAFNQFTKGESRVMLMSLRAGAGLEGLQEVCDVVVFAELDWSPAQITQCIGRLNRDREIERQGAVVAYFLLSDEGSDPFMCDTLGIKKQQSDFVMDPSKPLVEQLQVDPNHVKKLAMEYLNKTRQPGYHPPKLKL